MTGTIKTCSDIGEQMLGDTYICILQFIRNKSLLEKIVVGGLAISGNINCRSVFESIGFALQMYSVTSLPTCFRRL